MIYMFTSDICNPNHDAHVCDVILLVEADVLPNLSASH